MTRMLRIAAAAALFTLAADARANDDVLVARMAQLDQAYINPLFFTSNAAYGKSASTLVALRAAWDSFAADYRAYRPDDANWAVHFDAVDVALAEAEAIVFGPARAACGATPAVACAEVVPAHDALEAIRYELRDLRTHNGFPKFFTDGLTAFHGPMEAIVLSVKDLSPDQITDELLASLAPATAEADFLWSLVERTPLDDAWGFSQAQRAAILDRVAGERAALDAFAAALGAADRAALPALAVALKARFVPVYTSFAGDPALNKLP